MIISKNANNTLTQMIFNDFSIIKSICYYQALGCEDITHFSLYIKTGIFTANNLNDLFQYLSQNQKCEVIWEINEF